MNWQHLFERTLGVVLILLLSYFICNDQKEMKDNTIVQADALKSRENTLKHKTDSADLALDSAIVKEEKIRQPLRAYFKKTVKEVRQNYESLPVRGDTVQMLVNLIEKADSIIDVDSVELMLSHEQYLNQKAFADSLVLINSDLDGLVRKEAKRAEKLTTMLQRRNKVIAYGSGLLAVLAGLLLVR